MILHIDDKFLILKDLTIEERSIIKNHFTFNDMSKVFAGGSFNKRNIKKVSFLHKTGTSFFLFSGFLKRLLLLLKDKFSVEIKDLRAKSPNVDILKYLPEFEYVEHQEKALEKMKKMNMGIIKLPTSAGKTEIFFSYIRAVNLPTLIIVNRINLAEQTVKRFGEGMGICCGSKYKENTHMVCTIGSIKKIQNIDRFKILIVDECHRAVANKYQEFLMSKTFPYKFGFSATPFENDKYKNSLIEQHLGDIIYEIDINNLIEKEVIVKPKIKFIEIKCPKTIDWPQANLRCIVENNERNKKIIELVDKEKQTLILIKNIEHGKILNKMIEDSIFVSGVDDVEYRKEIIEDFDNKKINTIISTNIFNEGISISSINQLIIASGGKSKIETIQKIGRALRKHKNKKYAEVYDFMDLNNRFTEYHSKLRKSTYEKVGFEVK